MVVIAKRKLLFTTFISLSFFLLITAASRAKKWGTNGPWEAQEKPRSEAAEAQQFKNNVQQLKDKRDAEIAALVKERNAKIQALQDGLKKMTQEKIAKIKKDKQYIQQKMALGQDMTKSQAMLMQEEQALMKQSLAVQQQADNIKTVYDQRIRSLTQAYAQQFSILQQQFSTEK